MNTTAPFEVFTISRVELIEGSSPLDFPYSRGVQTDAPTIEDVKSEFFRCLRYSRYWFLSDVRNRPSNESSQDRLGTFGIFLALQLRDLMAELDIGPEDLTFSFSSELHPYKDETVVLCQVKGRRAQEFEAAAYRPPPSISEMRIEWLCKEAKGWDELPLGDW